MGRIFVPDSRSPWYDELNQIAYYTETRFEELVLHNISASFPGYIAIPFKIDVYSPVTGLTKRPDLALIREDLQEWWIIEAELSDHSYEGHVKDQVVTFKTGSYNAIAVAKYIVSKIQSTHRQAWDERGVIDLIQSQEPNILVIVDKPKHEWVAPLKKLDISLCYFHVFRNAMGGNAYLLDGKYPFKSLGESHCTYHRSMSYVLTLSNPQLLADSTETLIVIYEGRGIQCKKIQIGGITYLRILHRGELITAGYSYVLKKGMDNKFYLTIN